jgi:serine/threonine protein kinase
MQNYVGQQIDRYRITERLGQGGMAVVYKAYDTRLERDVALKLIRVDEIPASQHERLMKRFEREAKAMAKFSHPNIVPVHDYGEIDGSPYLVMEYVDGGTLKDRIKGPVNYQQAIQWVLPIADALSYAHRSGVIHRDVKPSNILFDREGHPILTDFGIAKTLESTETALTNTGLGIGTPEYMAPEQWQGEAIEESDQYALGIVLYELLTGQKPFTAETPVAIALKQMSEPLRKPSEFVPGIPEAIEKFLYKVLSTDPKNRYESMGEFFDALGHITHDLEAVVHKDSAASIDPEKQSRLEKIDSEGETVDVIEPTPIKSPLSGDKFLNQREHEEKGRLNTKILLGVIGGIFVLIIGLINILSVNGWGFLNNRNDQEMIKSAFIKDEATEIISANQQVNMVTETLTPEGKAKVTSTLTITQQTLLAEIPLASATSMRYITPTPLLYTPLSDCAPSHLHVGDSAFVSYDGGKNRIRSEPDVSKDNGVGEIQPGEVVRIVDGPVCNYGWILWEVETSRQETGWTPESDGDEFWLLPLTTRQICEGALPARLVIGKKAKVNEEPADSNLIRTGPSRFDEVIGKIKPGNWMMVLEGPVCGEKANWWKVECLTTGVVGWTMEGNLEIYYLSPEP